ARARAAAPVPAGQSSAAAAPAPATAPLPAGQPLAVTAPTPTTAPARTAAFGPVGRQLPVGGQLFATPEAVAPTETPAAPTALAPTAPAAARVVTSSQGPQDAHRAEPGTPVSTIAGPPAAAPDLPGVVPPGTTGPGRQHHLGAAGADTTATPAGGPPDTRTSAPRRSVPAVGDPAPESGPTTPDPPVVPNARIAADVPVTLGGLDVPAGPVTAPAVQDVRDAPPAAPLRAAGPPTPGVTPAGDAAPQVATSTGSETAVGSDGSDDTEPPAGTVGEPAPDTAGVSTAPATRPLPEPEPAPASPAVSASSAPASPSASRASAAPRIRLESSPAPASVSLPRPVTDIVVPPAGPAPAPQSPAPVAMATATPAPEALSAEDTPEAPTAVADDTPEADAPEETLPGPESAVRVQPVPSAAACAVPPERGIDQERAWLQRTLGTPFDAVAGSISRLLSELPGLRTESGRGGTEALSDLVAVKLYLSGGAPSLDAGVTAGIPGPHVPLARCVAAGLRRLPSYRGPVRVGAALTPAEWEWYRGRRLVMEWGFCAGDAAPPPAGTAEAGSPEVADLTRTDEPPEGPGPVDFLVWSMTARRTALIVQDEADRVVFLPGTGFKVLRVTGGDRPSILLRELSPSEISEDGRVSTRPVPLDTIALASLEKAELIRRPAKTGERKPLGNAPGLVISGTGGPDGPGEDTTQ
ncbi:hypothetical protein G3I56_41820, partial [Streptomyces sp. SID12488]|nr:hypothetical protein [Streptomyces sp. SID12488]